jgi:filamentous hemagglutinin family protein
MKPSTGISRSLLSRMNPMTTATTARLLLLCSLAATPLAAQLENPQVVAGAADFAVNGIHTTVTTSDVAIINYDQFGVPAGNILSFVQPGADSRVLNRVLAGADPSQILGNLFANGQVFLVNPAGVVFGPDAVIDAGAIYASAGHISDADFLSGHLQFNGLSGSILNQGQITAATVALIGKEIMNEGIIEAPDGSIAMIAGDSVFMGSLDDGIFIEITNASDVVEAAIANEGTLDAGDGSVRLEAGDFYSLAIRQSGVVKGGDILFRGGAEGLVDVGGAIEVGQDETGSMEVRAEHVALDAVFSGIAGSHILIDPVVLDVDAAAAASAETALEGDIDVTLEAEETINFDAAIDTTDAGAGLTSTLSLNDEGGAAGLTVNLNADISLQGTQSLDGQATVVGLSDNGDLADASAIVLTPGSAELDVSSNSTTNWNLADLSAFGTFTGSGTQSLTLTTGDDVVQITGANEGTETVTGLTFTGVNAIDADSGTDTLENQTGDAYDLANTAVGGITDSNFETIDTAALELTGGDDTFTVSGSGAGSVGALGFTGLSTVDGLGGTDTVALTAADETASISAANTATDSTSSIAFSGIEALDGAGGTDTLENQTGDAYDLANTAVGGITDSNFETIDTAALELTGGDDTFTYTGSGAGSLQGAPDFTGLSMVDALGGSGDSLINSTANAFDLSDGSINGLQTSNFETIDTAALELTGGDDTFTVSGSGAGSVGALGFTGLSTVDGLGGTDTVALTAADETASISAANTATDSTSSIAFSGIEALDGAGGTDTLQNQTGDAYDLANTAVGGITDSNFETIDTAALELTGGDDTFTVSGSGAGSVGALGFTGLSTVDGLGGTDTVALTAADETASISAANTATDSTSSIAFSGIEALDGAGGTDTLQNQTGDAYDLANTAVGGITDSNFETIDTAALELTGGDDTFTVSGSGAGSVGALGFTGLSTVDGLGGTDTVALTAADETASISAANTATDSTSSIAFSGIEALDGAGGTDTLQNQTGDAYDLANTAVGGITDSNFETIDTAALELTGGDDTFAYSGSAEGSINGITFTGLGTVDALAGNDTLDNNSGAAFDAGASTVDGLQVNDFDIVDTAALLLSGGDDSFSVTGTSAGSLLGGPDFTGVATLDGLGGTDTVTLTAGDETVTVLGSGAASEASSGFAFGNIEVIEAGAGTDSLINNAGGAFALDGNVVGGIEANDFENVDTGELTLTGGNDGFVVTGAGTGTISGIAFTGVATLDGLGGTDTVTLTAGDETVTVLGSGAASEASSGFAFGNIEVIEAGAGTDSLINNAGGAFALDGNVVGGIEANDFENVDTGELTLTGGNDGFAVTGAGTGTISGIAFTGVATLDGLGGTDTVTLTAGDETVTVLGSGAASEASSGFVFGNIEVIEAGAGTDSLINNAGGAFALDGNVVGGIEANDFENVDTGELTLTGGNDGFAVTGAGTGTISGIAFTGVATLDGLGGTDTVTLTAGDETVTVLGSGAASEASSGFVFGNIEVIEAGAGTDSLINNAGGAFALDGNVVGGITANNFENVDTAAVSLTTGNDTLQVAANGDGVINGITFTGVSTVDALDGDDAVEFGGSDDVVTIENSSLLTEANSGLSLSNFETVDAGTGENELLNNTGAAFSLETSSADGVTATGFDTIDTPLLALTAGDDTFTYTGAGSGSSDGTAFTGLTSVDALGGTDSLENETADAFDGADSAIGALQTDNFEFVQTASLDLTDGGDTFALTGFSEGTFSGITFTGLASVDALGGSDTVTLAAGNDAFDITGNNAGTGAGIDFVGIESVDASTGTGSLTNSTAEAFSAADNSVAGISVSNFNAIQTASLTLTVGDDTFSVNAPGTGILEGIDITYTGLTLVDALGGNNRLVNNSDEAFIAEPPLVAGISVLGFSSVVTPDLEIDLGNDDDLFEISDLNTGTDLNSNTVYEGLIFVDAQGGNDQLINSSGLAFSFADSEVAGVTVANFEIIDTPSLNLSEAADTFTVTAANAGTIGGIEFTSLSQVGALGGDDSIVLSAGNDDFTISSTTTGTGSGIAFSSIESVDGATGAGTLTNATAEAFSAADASVAGVSAGNFGTIQTSELTLTEGNDLLTVAGSGQASVAGIDYTGLTAVDALGGTDTVELTGADETATLTSANSATDSTSSIAYSNIETIDGGAGADILQNQAGGTYALEGNATAGVSQSNFETVDTAALSLTSGGRHLCGERRRQRQRRGTGLYQCRHGGRPRRDGHGGTDGRRRDGHADGGQQRHGLDLLDRLQQYRDNRRRGRSGHPAKPGRRHLRPRRECHRGREPEQF